jgi:hypothetical protein
VAEVYLVDGAARRRGVQRQLEQVDRWIATQQRLRQRLTAILHAMRETGDPSVDLLIQAMEAMMQATYLTPEQLVRMRERHNEVGGDTFHRWQQQWAELNEEASAHAGVGTDPSDQSVQTPRPAVYRPHGRNDWRRQAHPVRYVREAGRQRT